MKNIGKMTLDTPGDREIVLTREFDAPRQLVFDAYTKPELIATLAYGKAGPYHADMRDRLARGWRLPLRLAWPRRKGND